MTRGVVRGRILPMPRYFDMTRNKVEAVATGADVPLGGTRAQAVQRLQIGVAGVVLMVLMVGLASLVRDRVDEVETGVVPEAAATVEPEEQTMQNDPLVEAGVVPDLPVEPSPTPTPSQTTAPQQPVQDGVQPAQ